MKTLLATEAHTIFCTKDLRAAIGGHVRITSMPNRRALTKAHWSAYVLCNRTGHTTLQGGIRIFTVFVLPLAAAAKVPRLMTNGRATVALTRAIQSCACGSAGIPAILALQRDCQWWFDSPLVLLQSVVDRIVPQSIKGRRTKKQVYSRYPAHLPTGLR